MEHRAQLLVIERDTPRDPGTTLPDANIMHTPRSSRKWLCVWEFVASVRFRVASRWRKRPSQLLSLDTMGPVCISVWELTSCKESSKAKVSLVHGRCCAGFLWRPSVEELWRCQV